MRQPGAVVLARAAVLRIARDLRLAAVARIAIAVGGSRRATAGVERRAVGHVGARIGGVPVHVDRRGRVGARFEGSALRGPAAARDGEHEKSNGSEGGEALASEGFVFMPSLSVPPKACCGENDCSRRFHARRAFPDFNGRYRRPR